ncbi:SDR family oxidoreductase [uncultured Halopseudomonas sp.]|uniref:SDR family oxidoreductase n=1 Tax=uncultured Halopseudomonas sp. TaxID=2901193 RepID=UPI0030EC8477|tara:strand:- start:11807 stop:12496 length:690 start_codon:yes stop_codon:yes gene_type:complete
MSDPVLLITGASSGIGAATAREASRAGYRLVLAARSEDKLRSLQQELGGEERVIVVACDVQSSDDQLKLASEAEHAFGQIDAIFANAGRGGEPGGFSKADPDVWRDMLLTNVLGVALTVQACLPALRKSRGHILLTGSAAGRVTIPGSMYSATKWAVSAIGYGLREEVRGSGMRVTLIEPGMVDTPFFDESPDRALQPEDVARAVLYALSQPDHVDVNEVLIRPTPAIE